MACATWWSTAACSTRISRPCSETSRRVPTGPPSWTRTTSCCSSGKAREGRDERAGAHHRVPVLQRGRPAARHAGAIPRHLSGRPGGGGVRDRRRRLDRRDLRRRREDRHRRSEAPGAPGAAAPRGLGPALRRAASRVFNAAMRLALGLPFHDTQCGLKGLRREAARSLFGRARLDGFAFDAEILFLARRLGYEVVEVPVQARDRDGSKVRLAVDALRMLTEVWSVRRAAARGVYDQMRVRDHTG